jgi:hypothetical protein
VAEPPYDPAMARQIVLHVGTHKTGTTSLQQFLRDHADTLLAEAGVDYPPGLVIPNAHAELPLLAVRPDRLWPARIRLPETRDPAWLAAAERHVREVLRASRRPVVVLSHEDLSYARFDDELVRLRDLLGDAPVRVIVFLREARSFLESYRAQLVATGFELSDDPTSFAYVEPDSWLVDQDGLLEGYRRAFGASSVEVFDYQSTVDRDGSVIPTVAERLGIPRSSLPPLEPYVLNQTGATLRPTDEVLAEIRRRLVQQAS